MTGLLPPNPGVSGWHWLRHKEGWDAVWQWSREYQVWVAPTGVIVGRADLRGFGFHYLCPVPSADQSAAMWGIAHTADTLVDDQSLGRWWCDRCRQEVSYGGIIGDERGNEIHTCGHPIEPCCENGETS
jgi:hypothetical protein